MRIRILDRLLNVFWLVRRNQEVHELLVRAFLDLGDFFCFSEFFVVRDELFDVGNQRLPCLLIAMKSVRSKGRDIVVAVLVVVY